MTHLCCSKYCAFHIWCDEPEMVMIRSVEPGRGSSMVILAPESPRILRIRAPPLPIIAPANWKIKPRNYMFERIKKLSHQGLDLPFWNYTKNNFKNVCAQLTSFGMETWVVSVWPRSSSRNILSSWYILKCARVGEKGMSYKLQTTDDQLEIYFIKRRRKHIPARSTTDGLADTHQRWRWQVTFITAGPVTMSGWRKWSRYVTNQSRNLEFPFGTSRTAWIAHTTATTGSHANEDATFAVTAVLLSERLVIIVWIVLINWSLHLWLFVDKNRNHLVNCFNKQNLRVWFKLPPWRGRWSAWCIHHNHWACPGSGRCDQCS